MDRCALYPATGSHSVPTTRLTTAFPHPLAEPIPTSPSCARQHYHCLHSVATSPSAYCLPSLRTPFSPAAVSSASIRPGYLPSPRSSPPNPTNSTSAPDNVRRRHKKRGMRETYLGDGKRGPVDTAHKQALEDRLVEGRVRAAGEEPVELGFCEGEKIGL